jgi:DNA-directed RNA polymerase subunit M/transcription elongation factor TFIIS
MKYITIKESHQVNDLVFLQKRLESERINCRLKNELSTQVLNHIPSLMVELQVPENNLKRVREILTETGELKKESTAFECKNCGSEKLKFHLGMMKRLKIFFAFSIAALTLTSFSAVKLHANENYTCKECGHSYSN